MTKDLFLEDSYTKEFEARVVKLDGREVILDRTAFYIYDARFELLCVGVFQEELLGHSGRVPRSWFLKVATSR